MKLLFAGNNEIEIDSMSNRQALQEAEGKDVAQMITFTAIDTDVEIDDVVEMIKGGNNTGFTLNYGEGKQKSFEGFEISDLMEDIRDEKRVISIIATKIGAGI